MFQYHLVQLSNSHIKKNFIRYFEEFLYFEFLYSASNSNFHDILFFNEKVINMYIYIIKCKVLQERKLIFYFDFYLSFDLFIFELAFNNQE